MTQSQIARAFGVPLITVKRMCVKLRDEGSAGFFQPKPPAKGHRLTPDLIAQAQVMLDAGAAGHGQTNPAHGHVVEHLCRELNETETLYPGTDLTLVFRPLRSSPFHAGQDA